MINHRITALIATAILHCLVLVVPALTPPQDQLPAVRLTIGQASVMAEIADDSAERSKGLMGRTELADGTGMLFVFFEPQAMSFWMHDTLIPLSIAYINGQGIIREIHDMKPKDETPVPSIFGDLMYALEVPQGWFQRNKILPGDRVTGLPPTNEADKR